MTDRDLLARLLVERFGDDAATTPPQPEPKQAKRVTRKVADYPGARGPVGSGRPSPYHKGRSLEELLDE